MLTKAATHALTCPTLICEVSPLPPIVFLRNIIPPGDVARDPQPAWDFEINTMPHLITSVLKEFSKASFGGTGLT
jgi:hypothetical protein